MSWHRVDDGLPEHPKLAALEGDPRLWADALALWLAAACYCRRASTDGFVSRERLVRLSPLAPKRAKVVAQALVSQARTTTSTAGLWVEVEGGYRFHDWDDYGPGPTGGKPLTDAERAKRYRRKRHGGVTDSVTDRDAEPVTNRDAERDAARDGERHESHVTPRVTPRADAAARPRPVPSRPVATTNVVAAPVTATTTALAELHTVEAASERAEWERSERLALAAKGAYSRALLAAKVQPAGLDKYRSDLVEVGRVAEAVARRGGADVHATLDAWAKRYVAERSSRRPDWWLERVVVWAGKDTERGADTDELARLRAALDALEPARNRAVTAGARGVSELARIEAEQDAIRSQIADHRKRTNNPNPIARVS